MQNHRTLFCGAILRFADFYSSDIYAVLYQKAKEEFAAYPDFNGICKQQTAKAILRRKHALFTTDGVSDDAVDIAVEYILRELPFIISPAEILASDGQVFISYYSRWRVADYVYQRARTFRPSERTGLIIKDHACMEAEYDDYATGYSF